DPNENRWANCPLSLTFSQAGSGVPVWAATVTTDREGAFTLTGAGFAAGVYDVTVKGAHTLSNKKVGLALPQTAGASPMDFGTLRAGDLSNDDRMGADDYSVLVTNFALQQGPITLATVGDAAPHPVRLSLSPGPEQVEAGDAFTLDIIMDAGAQPVDSVSATLHFPPHLLQAVNPAGAEVNRLERSAALPVTLANQVDNHAGSVEFAAGRLPDADPLSGDVTVATVYFKALARLSAPLPVTLVPNGAIASAAYYQGRALTER
ncbi:MAG: cohesin domain-containing protein, partial [Chloroflexi bacterium]|nr:cohesin domain-containing protein [Chloroflexota bacterium]